jgi:hypothetical protein
MDRRLSGHNRIFGDYFRIDGHSAGTRTVGVSPFGLVDECIGDLALIEKTHQSLLICRSVIRARLRKTFARASSGIICF